MPSLHGLHHITCISGDAQENIDFYIGTLGMRLVKRSVNQDSPGTYHFFYADGAGTPGTDLTFFPWPEMAAARPGAGLTTEVSLAVPRGSIARYWRDRLTERGVSYGPMETRFGEPTLPLTDPHGLPITLTETDDERAFVPWSDSPVPPEHQVRGLHSARMQVRRLAPTDMLLTGLLGLQSLAMDDGWHRYGAGSATSGCFVEVKETPDERLGQWGTGGVHHIAWRTKDADEELALRDRLQAAGLYPSELIDRFWFKSVYFREPGGVLFELATDGPGFAVDEDPDHLGERLILPPWLEPHRQQIEAALPPITLPR